MAGINERYEKWKKERGGKSTAEQRYKAWKAKNTDLEGLGKEIASRTETWLKNHNQYVSNYNARYYGRKGNYEDSYVGDSGKWLDTVTAQKTNFDKERDNLLQILDFYGDFYDANWVSSVREALTGASKQQEQILKVASGDADFFGQFDDESQYGLWQTQEGYKNKYAGQSYEDIVAAMEGLEAGQERDWLGNYQYEALQKAEDFDRQSRYANEKKGIGKYLSDPTYEFINGRLSYALYNALAGVGADFKYDKMTEDEVAIYNYFYAKKGKEKAYAYLKSLNEKLVSREKQEIQEDFSKFSKENPVLASVASVPLSLLSGYEFSENALKYIAEKAVMKDATIDPSYTALASGVIRGTVAEQVDWQIGNWDAFDFVYNTAMSGADSLVGGLAFGNFGGAVLGLTAAAQATNDALERGMSDGQAFWNGLMSGVFEGLFETVSIGNFNRLKEVAPDSVKAIIKNLGKSMLVNASEEALTELANITYDTLINGEFANYTLEELKNGAWKNALGQVIEAGASGALMGLGMGGVGNAMGYSKGVYQAKQNFAGRENQLVEGALQADPDNTFAQKMQQRIESNKKLSGGQLLKLSGQVKASDMASMEQAAAQRLKELGATENVEAAAKAIAKQAAGQELSRNEARLAKQYDVVAGELKGRFDAEWTGRIGTKVINAQEYSRLIKMTEAEQASAKRADTTVSQVEAQTQENEYDGVAKQKSTGQSMVLGNVASVDGGKVMVQTDKGQIPLSDVTFEDADTEMLWRSALSAKGITTEGANGIIKAYDGKVPVATYLHGALAEYRNGLNNIASGDGMASKLTKVQREVIYSLAQKARQEKANEAKKIAAASSKPRNNSRGAESQNGVHFDRKGRSFDDVRETALKTMEQLHKILGVEFTVFESFEKDGKRYWVDEKGKQMPAPNGFYKDGMIYIDLNAGNTGKGTMLFTVAHELTHYIKEWSPEKFQVLSDFLLEQYGKKGISVNELVDRQMVKAEMAGRKLSWDEALEEVVADSMETMLTDGNAMQMMQQLKQKDKTLWERIADWFREFAEDLKKLVEAYKGVDPDSREGQLVADMQDVIGTLEQLYAEALVEAGDNASEAEKNTTEDGGEVMYSQRYLTADTNSEILSMVNKVANGEFKANEKVFLGTVSDAVADQIYGLTGIRVNGFKVAIEARQIDHILKDHGADGSSDHSMSDPNDIAKMEYTLTSPDDIRSAGKTQAYTYMRDGRNRTADTVLYEKNIGAKSYYVVQAVPDTRAKTLYIVTAFIGKSGYKKEASQLINAKSLDATAKTGSVIASIENVSQDADEVKDKFSDRDSRYLEAVNRGDTATAEKMVDEAAKAAGYTIKAFHGTDADSFYVFGKGRIGSASGVSILGDGFYFAEKKKVAAQYGKYVHSVYLKQVNSYEATGDDAYKLNAAKLEADGYDSVKLPVKDGNIYMVLDPEQIKSADPVTYDEQGNVIPLSQRFNPRNADIRYSDRDPELEKVNRVLEKENEGLKEDVSRLKDLLKLQRQVTGGAKITDTAVDAMAKQLMRYAGATGDRTELAKLLGDFYSEVKSRTNVDLESIKKAAQPAAKWLADHGKTKNDAYRLLREAGILRQVYDSYWRVSTLYSADEATQKQIGKLTRNHFDSMAEMRKTLTTQTARLEMEQKQLLRDVRSERREALDKQYKEISSKYQESRAKNVEGRKKTEMRRKIRRTIMDLNKLFTQGTKERNVKEGMKDFVAQALASAEVLFMDNYSNEDMVRYGVEVQLTAEENRLLDQTQSLLRQRDDLYSLGAIGTEGEAVIAGDTSAFDERMKKSDKLDQQIAKNMALLKSVFERERARLNEATVSKVLDDLAKAYKDLGDADETYIRFTTDETVHQFLQQLSQKMQGATVKDMSLDQLEDLHKAYKMVLTTIRNANKLFAAGKAESIESMAEQIAADFGARKIPEGKWALRAQKLLNKLGWDYEKLYYALDRIGSESFTRLMTNLADSENTVLRDTMEAKAFLQEAVEKYGFNNWNLDRKMEREFMDATGKKFQMSLGEMMSLYAYSRREGAWDHIEYGGFVFGKSGLDDPKPANAYKLNREQVEAITGLLTENQRGYVETMQKYLSETMGAKGNEVTMAMYGVELFTEKNYFPIHVSGVYKAQAQESQAKEANGFASMRNAGFTRSQNHNAKAPFVLDSFHQVWVDHVNEMSRYHGTVLALEDVRRVMNRSTYMDATAESVSVKQRLINSYGQEALRYFDELYREANSGAVRDRLEGTSRKMLSLFRKGSVAYSASVLVQQPASLVRAYAMIPKRYFGYHGFGSISLGVVKAASDRWNGMHTKAYSEMLKYAPGVTMAKEIGGFDTATGRSIRSYLLDTKKTFRQQAQTEKNGKAAGYALAALNKVDDNPIANLPNVADKIAWIEIWNACKRETVSTTNLAPGSEAFMEAVGKRFTEVIRATQVYDSIFAKSPLLRSKSLAVQYLVSFMNEPNTTANMAEKAIRDAFRGDGKSSVRTGLIVAYSIAFTNVLKSLVYAMRDDDEDETYIDKYIAAFAESMISDFNPMNYIPVARDVVSVLEGYDVERADMAVVADVAEAIRKVAANAWKDTSEMTPEQLDAFDQKKTQDSWKLAESLFAFFGIPVKNVRREILGAWKQAQIAMNNIGKTTWQSAIDSALEGLGVKQVKTQTLYRAVMAKDAKYLERLKKNYSSEEAYVTALRKALKAHDPRIRQAAQMRINGDVEGYKQLFRQIRDEGNFSFNDIMWAVNSAENEIQNKTEPEKVESAYSGADFVEAVVDGDTKQAEAMRQDMLGAHMANGMTEAEAEKKFVSAVTTGIRDAWQIGLIDEAFEAERLLREYAGLEEEEAAERVRYWQFQEQNPDSELSQKGVRGWYDYIETAEISLADYEAWYKTIGDFETDRDEDGDILYSAKEKGMDYIDSLDLTKKQKDALYLAMGWAESELKKAPWR